MKNVIIPLAILLSITGCKSTGGSESPDEQSAEANFRKVVDGAWISAEYVDVLSGTLSPMKSRDSMLATSLHEFVIDASQKGDSLVITGYGPQDVEVTEYKMVLSFKPGLTPTSFPVKVTGPVADTTGQIKIQELSYEIKGTDTTLFIKNYNEKQKLLSQQKFLKVSGAGNNPGSYIENKLVLAGEYDYKDDSGKVALASFMPDGHMSGMGSHNVYTIGANHGEGAPRFDYIYTSAGTDEDDDTTINYWGYERLGDSLLLYSTKRGEYNEPNIREGVKYVLVRKK